MKTLVPDLAGPVSVRQFARHAAAVLRAVREDGRTVALSRHGRTVAVIRPARREEIEGHGVDLEDPEATRPVRSLERDGVSEVLRSTDEGACVALTWHNRPFALVVPATEWHDFDALFDGDEAADAVPAALTETERSA